MKTTKLSHTRSAGTKLTAEQYATIKAQAEALGLDLSEYIRRTLLTAAQAETSNPIEALLLAQLQETLALRIFVLNLASAQASGAPLTAERLQEMRAYADEHKAARARLLLSAATTHNQATLAASSESKVAA